MYSSNTLVNARRTVYPEHTSAAQDQKPKRRVYKFNQNPLKLRGFWFRGTASNPKTLHTLIHNTSTDWSDAHQRRMTPSERPPAQGFPAPNHPVGPHKGTHERRTSSAKQRDGRKFQETKGQAGDSTNVRSVGATRPHAPHLPERPDTVKRANRTTVTI
jgi:hypothetical protein